jgi:putative PIN family toxin of toxin-antitoxin system
MQALVLDTNIVLDLWVYQDPATPDLLQALQSRHVHWLATAPMREELVRVLDYPHIAARRAQRDISAAQVLGYWDAHAQVQGEAPRAPYACKDADDQKFVDLAAQHQAWLISKDKQVLRMKNRLARLGARVASSWADLQPCA